MFVYVCVKSTIKRADTVESLAGVSADLCAKGPYLSELLQCVSLAGEPAVQRGALALQGSLSLHTLSWRQRGQITYLS